MNADQITEIRSELNELQQQAVDLAAVNAPMPAQITKRTLRALVRRGLLTEDQAGYFWITDLGRRCATPKPKAEKKTRTRKPTNCADCEIRLTPSRRSDSEELCRYCEEASMNFNEHQDGAPVGTHTADQPCTECGTWDPTAHYAPKPRVRKAPTPQDCRCGCGKQTKGGNYLPGHDARHAGQVARWIVEQNLDDARMQATLDARFWDTPLLEAKCRASVERQRTAAARKLAKAEAKAESK